MAVWMRLRAWVRVGEVEAGAWRELVKGNKRKAGASGSGMMMRLGDFARV